MSRCAWEWVNILPIREWSGIFIDTSTVVRPWETTSVPEVMAYQSEIQSLESDVGSRWKRRMYYLNNFFFCLISIIFFHQCTLTLFGGSLLSPHDFWKWTSLLNHWIWHVAQVNSFSTFHPLEHSDLVQGWAKDQDTLSGSKTSQSWDLKELYLALELPEVSVWTLRRKLA